MSLLRRVYDLLYDRLSATVDEAQDPEDKIRAVMHTVADQASVIRGATAGPIASYNALLVKRDALTFKINGLEVKIRTAADKNNDAARVYAGQLVDARSNLVKIEIDLAVAKTKADEARQNYVEWKEKAQQMHQQAAAALSEAERTRAQKAYNETMRDLDRTSLDSGFSEAANAIEANARRADAEAELDSDPNAEAVRDFDKAERNAEINRVLEGFTATPTK